MHKSISCSWLLRREGFICVGLVMCVCVCARVFSSMTIWKLPQNERQNKTFAAWQICVEFITSQGTISLSPSPNFPPANHLLKIVERKSKKPRWFLKEVKQTKKKKKKKGHRATPQTGLGSLKLRKKHLRSSCQLGEHTDCGGKAVCGWFTLFY